jgi:hypothetical protein
MKKSVERNKKLVAGEEEIKTNEKKSRVDYIASSKAIGTPMKPLMK